MWKKGYIYGTYVPVGTKIVFYSLDWSSSWQGCVSFSSMGTESLSASFSVLIASLIPECLEKTGLVHDRLSLVVIVDCNWLYVTSMAHYEVNDSLFRSSVAIMRASFETGEIKTMQWIHLQGNISDVLNMRNIVMFRNLKNVMTCSKLEK